jgi:hypothetical protein
MMQLYNTMNYIIMLCYKYKYYTNIKNGKNKT